MTSSSPRRAAERAARALVAGRSASIGDLGVRHATLQHAQQAATAARDRGNELVELARQQAQQLLQTAEQDIAVALEQYAQARTAAYIAGWPSTDLDALGFPTPTTAARRRHPTPATSNSTTANSTTGSQPEAAYVPVPPVHRHPDLAAHDPLQDPAGVGAGTTVQP